MTKIMSRWRCLTWQRASQVQHIDNLVDVQVVCVHFKKVGERDLSILLVWMLPNANGFAFLA